MQYRYGLPDGGEIEESMGHRIQPVGDRGLPSPVVYRHLHRSTSLRGHARGLGRSAGLYRGQDDCET
ncbi:MAG: hypothetical protein JWR32_4316 [Mycobacterium sp.]|nr:hypothetical protein [Mycobacterium sp.]